MLIFKKKKTCYHVKNNDLIKKKIWKVIKIGCQGDEIDNHLEKKKKKKLATNSKKKKL